MKLIIFELCDNDYGGTRAMVAKTRRELDREVDGVTLERCDKCSADRHMSMLVFARNAFEKL